MGIPAIFLALVSLAGVDSAADVVTLKDGTEVLGQVVNPSRQGKAVMIVRREWAEAAVPEKAKRGEPRRRRGWLGRGPRG